MFKFLKEKLKSAISKISEGVEKEGKIEERIEDKPVAEEPKKEEEKGFFAKLKEKFVSKEEEKHEQKIHSKNGFFDIIKEKIITTKINEEQFDKLFWDLELALMENNIAVEVIGKIKNDLKNDLVEKPIKRTRIEETIQETLKSSIEGLFLTGNIDLIQEIKNKDEKPYVIAFFGINGSGKTTSIAKIANMLKEKKISCVLAASDTFRAASIEQLQQHADKIGVKVIKHNYGADPAAVAFDAIKHAKAKNIDAVLIDTAGRMHSNVNLIDELKKITRVAKPDLKIFVGESITGNDCVEQVKTFNEAVGIDGIILAKADVDEKGGAAVSVSYVTKKPILFLGTGQKYGDLEPFSEEKIIKSIGLF